MRWPRACPLHPPLLGVLPRKRRCPAGHEGIAPMISLADLQRRIEKGELSPDDALAQSLAAIEAQDKKIGAFVRRASSPRAQASGPLRGIAVGIKDIIDTSDMPTEMGAAIYKGHRP